MISKVDQRFRDEARLFELAFTCDRCALFDEDGDRCSHEYPNQQHRQRALSDVEHVVFCKEFELR